MSEFFAKAFNAGDVEDILKLYTEDAVLVTDNSRYNISGREAIRDVLTDIINLGGVMTAQNTLCIARRDLALLRAKIDLSVEGRVVASDEMSALAQRGADGFWLYAGSSLPRLGAGQVKSDAGPRPARPHPSVDAIKGEPS